VLLSTLAHAAVLAVALTTGPVPPFAHTVDTIAQGAIDKTLAPGMAVAVVRNGSIIYEAGFGVAGPDNAPVTPATRFAIGSLTKQFTAVAALQLVRQARLSLDDPLSKFLPALPNATSITVRELLDQTSGLHNYPNPREHKWPSKGPVPPSALFAFFAEDKSDFNPGTKWAYSNTNYAALAEIVARTTGKPYGTVLAENIFDPLGMTASGYGFASQRPSDATPAEPRSTAWTPESERVTLDVPYGAGGIISTPHDMATWDSALLGDSFIDDATRKLLWEPGRLSNGAHTAYGMGFVIDRMDGHRMVWHNGSVARAGGFCYNALFPQDGLAVVVLTNSGKMQTESAARAIDRAVLDGVFPRAKT
jgi:D-alanyl-D-alanine carboxypeptidase